MRLLPMGFAAVLLLVGVGTCWDQRKHRNAPRSGTAGQWIWSAADAANETPTTFLLVRTFDVDRALLEGRAVLRMAAEPAARVDCNGLELLTMARSVDVERVPVLEIDVTEALHVGSNRLAIETGSVTGAGGIWLELRLFPGSTSQQDQASLSDWPGQEPAQLLVASDASWQTVRHPAPGVREGWRPVRFAEPVHVWGPPGIGRWQDPRKPVVPRGLWATREPPRRIEVASLAATIVDLPGTTPGSRVQRQAWSMRFDEVATGRLELTFDPPAESAELIWPEDLDLLGPNAHQLLLSPERRPPHPIRPLAGVWRDRQLRQIEEVLLLGPRPKEATVLMDSSDP